jgi:PleD family two-component response regulator
MKPEAMATRLAVLTRALPMRILLVEDDELEMELMADRLQTAGFEVTRAHNGEEALTILDQHWHPVVITDWQMPVMDGIAFTEALRARGVDDTYVIMLTMRGAHLDYERGYISGVDDYLTKKVPDVELFARIHAAFNTLALRRSLQETRSTLQDSVAIDADSGAFAPRELLARLHSEIRRAQRYGRQVSIIAVNVTDEEQYPPEPDVLRRVVQAIDQSVRAHVDWVGRLESATPGATFVLVLPEAALSDLSAIHQRVRSGLLQLAASTNAELGFQIGAAALDRSAADGAIVEASDMIDVAMLCLACPGRSGEQQLRAVQRSVGCHAAIVCRHGYVVDGECTLKADSARSASPEFARAG